MAIGRPKAELILSDEELETLQRWARRPKSSQFLALRSRIVLACSRGLTNTQVAEDPKVTKPTAVATGTGTTRTSYARLRPPRHDLAVRRAQRGDWGGHRSVSCPAPAPGVSQVLGPDRSDDSRGTRRRNPLGDGQPCRAQDGPSATLVGQATAIPSVFHADECRTEAGNERPQLLSDGLHLLVCVIDATVLSPDDDCVPRNRTTNRGRDRQ